jgi:large subunit ribosomal protein L15
MKRKGKKKDKLRGHRSHGKGNTKNKRGAGTRGGRGRAGSHKHKFNKYHSEFGVKKTLKAKPKINTVNLSELNELIEKIINEKKAVKEKNLIVIDGKKLKIQKLLSRGNLKEKVLVRNMLYSKKAKEKLLENGSKIEGMNEIEAIEKDEFELVEGEKEA